MATRLEVAIFLIQWSAMIFIPLSLFVVAYEAIEKKFNK